MAFVVWLPKAGLPSVRQCCSCFRTPVCGEACFWPPCRMARGTTAYACPFSSLVLALWGVKHPCQRRRRLVRQCAARVWSVFTPHPGAPCLVWLAFGSSPCGFCCGLLGHWLAGVPLLGGQVSPSTVSPGAVVRDRKATTFAMPPSKGIRALDFSVVTLLWALVCYASA
jgi:hypothetical protein